MNTKAFFLAIMTVAIWGSSFAAISASLNGGFPPGHLSLYRFLIASLIFAVVAFWPGSKFKLPEKSDIWKILILGWIGISLYHVCVTFGQMTISAGTAGMLIGSAPIVTTVMAVVILNERLGKVGWVGLGFGFVGIILIALGTGDSSFDISPGVFLVLTAAIATSIFFVYQKPLFKKYSPIELTAYSTYAGTVPLPSFLPGQFDNLHNERLEANLSAIYIGIFPTALAYLTWAIALSKSNASSISNTLYAEPVVAIIITWIWLHELPSPLSIVGGTIAISSLLLVNLYGKKQRLTLKQENTAKNHI